MRVQCGGVECDGVPCQTSKQGKQEIDGMDAMNGRMRDADAMLMLHLVWWCGVV